MPVKIWAKKKKEKSAYLKKFEELLRGKKDYYMSKLFDLLDDAVRLRLGADVPVAAYLSGGLDSTIIAALIKKA